MEISDRIRLRIKELGLKSVDITKATGVSSGGVSHWLNDKATPKGSNLLALAKLLRCKPEWIMTGKGDKDLPSQLQHYDNLGHVDVYESGEPLHPDEVEVPFFTEVELSAGNGFNNVSEIATQQMRFNLSTLSSAGVAPSKAACCKVSGDSMEPVLPDGSIVGIDTSDTSIKDGKMYAINHGGMLRVKYLYRMPFNGMRIRSANPDYHDEEVSGETTKEIRVVGRVFWNANIWR